jgi:hypothetical protein
MIPDIEKFLPVAIFKMCPVTLTSIQDGRLQQT